MKGLSIIMKAALIGAGVIGTLHAKVIAGLGIELVAICDVDEKKAESLATLYAPKAAIYTDYKKMIGEIKVDAVHICTPHVLHAEQVIYALGCGVNVLCEKPLCAHPEQLAGVLEAEERSSATLGVSQQNRYNSSVKFALEYLSKTSKKIKAAHGSVCWHRDISYYEESPWRGRLSEAGGGSLINQALHTLDLLEVFCGVPSNVTARADILNPKKNVEVEDTVTAVFSGGADFTFFSSNNSPSNLPVELSFKLDSGENMIILPKAVVIDGKNVYEDDIPVSTVGKSYYGGSHGKLFEDYYTCIAEGKHFPIDGKEASKVMKLIFAVYASKGEKINI